MLGFRREKREERRQIQAVGLYSLLFASCFLLLAYPVFAGSNDQGKATATFLKLDPSAQTAGFGSAYTARADDVQSVYFNPAGLGFIEYNHGLFTYNDIFAGISYNYISYAMPLNKGEWGGFGIGVTLLDYGNLTKTQINGANPVTNLGTFSSDDLAVALSYGRKLNDNFSLGLTLKYVKETIDSYDDNTVAGDIGLRWITDVEGLTVGLAYRNIGGDLKFVRESDPLPRAFQGGIALEKPLWNERNIVNFGIDVIAPNDAGTYVGVGLEYTYNKLFSMRVGYNGQQDADNGLTVGAGFHLENLSIDYAFVPYDELGDQHRVSLGLIFGGSTTKK